MRTIECADRNEWLLERRKGIGGSDAPTIMRLSPWSNPVELFQEKLGLAEPKEESAPMRWGTLLEPVIRQQFQAESGMAVEYPGSYVIAVSDRDAWHRASLDGTVKHPDYGTSVLEIKAVNAAVKEHWEAGPPPAYFAQIQHQMAVTGLPAAVIAVLFGGQELQWFTVLAEPAFQEVMFHQESAFWQNVITQEPPAPQTDDEIASLAKTMLATQKDKKIEVSATAWLQRHRDNEAVKAEIKRLKAETDKFRNELIVEAGDAELVEIAGTGIQYAVKLVEKKPYQVKAQRYRVVNLKGGGEE